VQKDVATKRIHARPIAAAVVIVITVLPTLRWKATLGHHFMFGRERAADKRSKFGNERPAL